MVHPQVGLWHTAKLQEAEEMLAACQEYARSVAHEYDQQFVIIEAETYEELCQYPPQAMV